MKKKKKIILIISIAILSFVIINMIGAPIAYDIIFQRGHDIDLNSNFNYDYSIYKDEHKREEITYSVGDHNLKGYAYLENDTTNLIVVVHGFQDFADYLLEQDIYFVENGYNVFTFDASGCGHSEGKTNGFSQTLMDLDKTLDFLEEDSRFSGYDKYLFGFSEGAYSSCSVLQYKDNIKGVCAISGYNDAKNLVLNQGKRYVGPLAYLGAPIIYIKQNIMFGSYIDVIASEAIMNSNTKVFLAHGNSDTTVPYYLSIYKEFENSDRVSKYKEDAPHSGILYSKEAREYQKKMKKAKDADRALFNELNEDLFEQVLSFYASC